MFSLLKTNQFFGAFILLIYTFVVRLAGIVIPQPNLKLSHKNYLLEKIFSLFPNQMLLQYILGCIAVWVGAVILNLIVNKFRFYTENNQGAGMFYVLLCSIIPEFLGFSPILFCNIILMFALYNMLNTYKGMACADNIFNVGFFISLATLFFLPNFMFLFWGFMSLSTLRSFKLNERLQMIFGVITPIFLLFSYLFISNELQYLFNSIFNFSLSYQWISSLNLKTIVYIGLFLLFVLISIFNINTFTMRQNISVHKYINILFWMLLFGGLSVFFAQEIQLDHLMIIAIPLSIFIFLTFVLLKNRQLAEVLHLFLLVAVLVWQFNSLWFSQLN